MQTIKLVQTRPPSFPEVRPNTPLPPEAARVWQVLCGDTGHWRLGFYSPAEASADAIAQLEQHDCPELFLLLEGRLTLLLAEGDGTRELQLEPGQPVLISAPHAGFCPDGPHTGTAVVVERDNFDTEYRPVNGWLDHD
jgi:hypothetical protein